MHRPTGFETAPPYAFLSSRFGSEPPSVEDDIDVWRYTVLELHARNDDYVQKCYCHVAYFLLGSMLHLCCIKLTQIHR